MASWIDWAIFVVEIIIIIIKKLPKMGYEAARALAFGTVAERHGLTLDDLEAHCGGKIDAHFGK